MHTRTCAHISTLVLTRAQCIYAHTHMCAHKHTRANSCTFVSTQTICISLAIALVDKSIQDHSGHSFRVHPEAVYAVVDDLELPSNEGVAKVSNCYL